jgi:hypothetical protein
MQPPQKRKKRKKKKEKKMPNMYIIYGTFKSKQIPMWWMKKL